MGDAIGGVLRGVGCVGDAIGGVLRGVDGTIGPAVDGWSIHGGNALPPRNTKVAKRGLCRVCAQGRCLNPHTHLSLVASGVGSTTDYDVDPRGGEAHI